MFEKKQFIYSETMGVCKVVDIVRLSTKKDAGEGIYYYHLKAVSDKLQDAYIPVEHHEVQLRELISKEEASSLLDFWHFEISAFDFFSSFSIFVG